MERAELLNILDTNPRYDYIQMDNHDLLIADTHVSVDGEPDHHPITSLTPEAVLKNTWDTIRAACTHGKDVDHVTRITGYFSKVSGWNQAKQQELRERHRESV